MEALELSVLNTAYIEFKHMIISVVFSLFNSMG